MLKKLTKFMSSILDSNEIKQTENAEVLIENQVYPDLELDIKWDDIINGFPSSDTNSIISNSLKRNGLDGNVTACKITLNNGMVYVPCQLSDHWEAFIGSPKTKPKIIKYINITNT
jgi:hypothetical protein